MKIIKLKINGFGRFVNKEISFGNGLNLVYGRNEAGKSTIQNFIKASLYGFINQRTDGEGRPPEKSKYKPWDSGDYSGFIEVIKEDGKKLRIERDFETNETLVFDENLANITSSFDHQARMGIKVGENLLGIDRESFENSVFIGQGSTAVTQSDRNHMFEKIVNIMNTGKEDESASSALAAISKAQRNLGNSRTQDKPYNKALSTVESIEREFSSARQRNSDMSENMKRKQFLEEEIVHLKSDIAQAESLERAEIISGRILELENTKRRFQSLANDINILDKEIYEDKIRHAKLNSADVSEQDVLHNIQQTVSSMEKQKRIPKGNHIEELAALMKQNANKKIISIVLLCLSAISIPLAILLNPLLFAVTALFLILWVLMLIKKPVLSVEQLRDYIELNEECQQDLDGINVFITRSGHDKAKDFNDAKEILNLLYREIKEKASLSGVIDSKESRNNGQQALANEILGNFKSLSELNKELDKLMELKEKTNPEKRPVKYSVDDLKTKLGITREELAGVNRLLDEFFHDEDELADLEERLESARETLASINEDRKALSLTDELIRSAAESLRGNIFPVINEKMGKIISRITNGRHKMLLAGLGKTMNTDFNDNARTIWNFSDGTIDQMYLSLRLALTDAMSENESLPVFIDEAFAYYDEERIKSVFELLNDLSLDHQIIVFTCKESELEIVRGLDDVNIILL